jgi:hypothetical protein
MSKGSRHGQARYEAMITTRAGTEQTGKSSGGFQKRVPAWYVGDVDVFLAALKLMDEGKMPRPTEVEMSLYDALLIDAAAKAADEEAEAA